MMIFEIRLQRLLPLRWQTRALVVVLVASFASCNRDKEEDTLKPVIEISAPEQGTEISNGSNVRVAYTVSDDNDSINYSASMTTTTEEVLWTEEAFIQDTSLSFSSQIPIWVTYKATVRLRVNATDNAGNTQEEEVVFRVTP